MLDMLNPVAPANMRREAHHNKLSTLTGNSMRYLHHSKEGECGCNHPHCPPLHISYWGAEVPEDFCPASIQNRQFLAAHTSDVQWSVPQENVKDAETKLLSLACQSEESETIYELSNFSTEDDPSTQTDEEAKSSALSGFASLATLASLPAFSSKAGTA